MLKEETQLNIRNIIVRIFVVFLQQINDLFLINTFRSLKLENFAIFYKLGGLVYQMTIHD